MNRLVAALAARLVAIAANVDAASQDPAQPSIQTPRSVVEERVEVIATRVPESPRDVPAPVEVFLGSELLDRGAHDLRSALALATGVDISPGGDNGPASSVPEFWGLREFDAFLLVVDGVPWGGAFNPDLATISVEDIARVEVLRGPAPVTYGATSFVGVINVVRKPAAAAGGAVSLHRGSFGSGGGAAMLRVPTGNWDSRVSGEVERQGYRDDRTSFVRGHVLWRTSAPLKTGQWWFGVDGTWLDQKPASPHPQIGQTLTPLVPIDANQNPDNAFLNSTRTALMSGFARKAGSADWTLTGSFSRATQDQFRGFLEWLTDTPGNAVGLREKIDLTDVYVDSHLAWSLTPTVRFIAGGDYVFGEGTAHGATFEYDAPLDGAFAPVVPEPTDLPIQIEDRRQFFGGYSMVEWRPTARLRIDGGVRLNVTRELREGGGNPDGGGEEGEEPGDTHVRPSGSAGVMFTAWSRDADSVGWYVNYRDTFKPAAFDFGLGDAGEGAGEDPDAELLEPETARSVEGGMKSRWLDGRLEADVSVFHMNFANLVIAQSINGLPSLANAGTETFDGLEGAVSMSFARSVSARATYSVHDATFDQYQTVLDGVPVDLSGKRLEMSARQLASFGVIAAPPNGMVVGGEVNYVGSRYLNKRNTARADGYFSLTLMGGYRIHNWEVRVDGRNLTNARPPVSESELGDSQYYLLPARHVDVTMTKRF
jgi:outer membrane receptor protein involved in Fe transport